MLEIGQPAFRRALPFSELNALTLLLPFIRASLNYERCFVVAVNDARKQIEAHGELDGWSKEKVNDSEPGAPAVQFWNPLQATKTGEQDVGIDKGA